MADLLPVHKIGTGSNIVYFRTSDVYGETGGVGAKVGITKVKDTDLTGKETIVPVKELLRTADLMRLVIRYKSGTKSKSARVLVTNSSMSKLFGLVGTDKLEGTNYKVGTETKGSINSIGMPRRASYY
jgi:hypothetical protein